MNLTFADIQPMSMLLATAAKDVLIAPDGRSIPIDQRWRVIQSVFNMTPMEFKNRYKVSPDNGLVYRGYIYAMNGVIYMEVDPDGITDNIVKRISSYVLSMPSNTPLEVTMLQHDPRTFQVLNKEVVFQGTVDQLRASQNAAVEQEPSVGGGLQFQQSPNIVYTPSTGKSAPEAQQPSTTKRNFSFPVKSGELKTADIVDSRLPRDIEVKEYDVYGLPVIVYDGKEYALGTEKQVAKAAYNAIMDSVWAFNADWLVRHMRRGMLSEEGVKQIQLASSESANEMFKNMLTNKKQFVEDSIDADGRAHFLSTYDGEEYELSAIGLEVVDLPKELLRKLHVTRGYSDIIYAYRTN